MRETVLVQFSLVGTYQVSLSRGADLHLMTFFLDVLNQVIQHVGLGEILNQNKQCKKVSYHTLGLYVCVCVCVCARAFFFL